MWYVFYNIGLVLAGPIIVLILLAKKRCRRGLPERLGWLSPEAPVCEGESGSEKRPVIWVHAVSLGEVVAATPLIRRLRTRYPDHRVLVSTVTETGREAVGRHLTGVATHFYAPLDFPWVVGRVVDRLRPEVFVFVETELWPNLLRALDRRRIPAILVNGRLSTRSFQGYRLIGSFWRRVLEHVTWSLMQSGRDAERMLALGASRGRVVETGNLKFDQLPPEEAGGSAGLSRRLLGLEDDEELLVAGSTHAGEEEQLLACYRRLHQEFPSLVLTLAPRHIERSDQVEAAARAAGWAVVRRSRLGSEHGSAPPPSRPRVVILDTRGELVMAYRYAVLTFVGGTLVPIGGHNLLEPARWGKPVFFGPHTDHCADVAALLVRAQGGVQVGDGRELAVEMAKRLRDRPSLQRMGERAGRVTEENQGALQRTLEVIEKVLEGNAERERMDALPGTRHGARGEGKKLHPLPLASRPLPHLFRPVLRWLVFPYAMLVTARALLYQRGWLPRRRLPCPVVSVGNLTVGGTGKTPLVIMLAGWLLARGTRVGVLSRGYRRQGRNPLLLVSDGRTLLAGPAEAGDEPYLIARRCPGAVVAVGADRHRLGQWVLEQCPIDCFLLDDGFQHLALHRDVDLLLVDASDPGGLEGLFPAGRLREPLSAASRASAVMLTRIDRTSEWKDPLVKLVAACGPDTPPIHVKFTADALVDVTAGGLEDVKYLSGKTGIAFSGIGNAGSFRCLLDQQGLQVLGERIFPDHHTYTSDDVLEIVRLAEGVGAELILTTEKDAGKVAGLFPAEHPVFALRLGTEILDGRERLFQLLQGIGLS